MQRASLLSALFVIMIGAANAAPSSSISGNYAVTGTSLCIASPPNVSFTGLSPPLGSVNQFHVVETKRTFNSGGTGSATGNTMGIESTFNGSSSSDSFSFTYTINPDGTWTSQIGTFSGTVTSGPRNGQTFSITNFPPLTGLISPKATTLTLATESQQVETITYSNSDVVQRLCAHSRVLAPLP